MTSSAPRLAAASGVSSSAGRRGRRPHGAHEIRALEPATCSRCGLGPALIDGLCEPCDELLACVRRDVEDAL